MPKAARSRAAPSRTATKRASARRRPNAETTIRFTAKLRRPASAENVDWLFLLLPKSASDKLPSRGQSSVAGTINTARFEATLEPDGKGGHWLKIEEKLRAAAQARVGELVALEIASLAAEPEPKIPADLHVALAAATPKTRETWSDITPAARRDFVHWVTSPKKPETRAKRISTACDMLAKGKRRPCCFDRSGMFSKSLSCPIAAD